MESLTAWAAETGVTIEPYGVEISAALADLARQQHPEWADRIWTANSATWTPPRRFDMVRTGIGYVPRDLQANYVEHLESRVVAPGGWLIIGVYNEEKELDTIADRLVELGHEIAGRVTRDHRHPAILYKAVCLDNS